MSVTGLDKGAAIVRSFLVDHFTWLPKPTVKEDPDWSTSRYHSTATAIFIPHYTDSWNEGDRKIFIHEIGHVLAFNSDKPIEGFLAAMGADPSLINHPLINEIFAEHFARAYVDGYDGRNYPDLVAVVPFDAAKMRAFCEGLIPAAPAGGRVAPVVDSPPAGSAPLEGKIMRGIDYANARGAFFLGAVKQAGYDFVVRYLDGGRVPGKQLTPEERDRNLAAGLGIFLAFETTGGAPNLGLPGGAAYFTRAQGAADAQEAITAANALGYPEGAPIFYAVDQGLAAADVVEYFNGTDDIHYVVPSDPLAYNPLNPSHFESGAYGDYDICETAATVPWRGVPWRFQTAAWSGGKRADGAQLYQAQNGVLVAGSPCDIDELAPGVVLPKWTITPPPDPLWSRPDSSPWTVGDAREYARRLQGQLDATYARK